MRWDQVCKRAVAIAFLMTASHAAMGAQKATASCEVVRPLAETHTIPPYPAESVHNDEEGTVVLKVDIARDGVPAKTVLETSSGFPRLDDAGLAWVKNQWRWQPRPARCSTTGTRVSIKWDLDALRRYNLSPEALCSPAGDLNPAHRTNVSDGNAATVCRLMNQGSQPRPAQGITLMEVHFEQGDGVPVEVKILTSSGSARLDDAAKVYVSKNFRWKPMPIPVVTHVCVAWSLRSPDRIDNVNASSDNTEPGCTQLFTDAGWLAPLTHTSAPYDAGAITRQLLDHH